jgi:hypothetical protein
MLAYIDANRVRVRYFNIHSQQQKKSFIPEKDSSELNDTVDQIDIADIYRIFYTVASQYAFFSATHKALSKIEHTKKFKI